jgi:hypothetical protein
MRAELDERVKSLEENARSLRSLPARVEAIEARLEGVETQIVRTREELVMVIHATSAPLATRAELLGTGDHLRTAMQDMRGEMHGIRDALRAEMHGIRDELRAEIRASAEESRRHWAVLLEHAVAQMHALFDASRQPPP